MNKPLEDYTDPELIAEISQREANNQIEISSLSNLTLITGKILGKKPELFEIIVYEINRMIKTEEKNKTLSATERDQVNQFLKEHGFK